MRVIQQRGAPRLQSRIHGPRRIIGELRRLIAKVDRAAAYRSRTDVERHWCAKVGDTLEQLARDGDLLLRMELGRPHPCLTESEDR